MNPFLDRRHFLLATVTMPLMLTACVRPFILTPAHPAETLLAGLEATSGGRLGVYAVNTANGAQISYRADERFPFCSTFKMMLAAAILAKSTQQTGLLQQRVHYAQSDLVTYSPISGKHLDDGMTVAELCAAAIQYSDNTAANLLIKELGGPAAVTAFARSIGNTEFRLDRWETELNSAIPGDERDTVTPAAMARSLQALTLGDALPPPQQKQLNDWLLGNTTGGKRIRAAAPKDWRVGDKTGSGDYGTANDIAVLWPPSGKPVVLAIYHTQKEANAKWRDEVVAEAARIVVAGFTL
jgi:beta-lactamase class A